MARQYRPADAIVNGASANSGSILNVHSPNPGYSTVIVVHIPAVKWPGMLQNNI
jgi:hypothetical protein